MRWHHPVIGFATVMAVSIIALYAFRGRPDLASVEARMDQVTGGGEESAKPAAASMADMIQHLKDKVAADPKDVDAWQNLGWAYMHIHQPADAVEAYRHAVSLAPGTGDYLSALAEAEVQAGDGKITPVMLAEFKRAAASDPTNARARFYLALYKDQQGDHRGAVADWIALLESAPANASWAPEVRGVVEQVAKEEHLDIAAQLSPPPGAIPTAPAAMPGPTGSEVAAAEQMPPKDRQAMIEGMVDKLAAQLKQSPHDAGGWQRLMRARMVLGEKDKALAAYRSACGEFARDPAQLTVLNDTARRLGVVGE
jgi:cytochrome c-type biogenesis protein CcmH